MKPLFRIVVAAVMCLGAAASAAAQTSPGVLNKLKVQKLVAEETPVAHLALAAHFNAVADQYVMQADRHRATAAAYRANANRSATTTAGSHYERLAAAAREWATAARELAKYHVALAGGRAAVLPHGAVALHGGRGAPEPTAQQLHQLALTARTRRDHLVLVEYFTTVANGKAADADRHLALAVGHRAGLHKGLYDPAATCDRLARIARRDARKAAEAASLHKALANVA